MVTVKAPTKTVGGRFFTFKVSIATRKAYLKIARNNDKKNRKKVKKALISSGKLLIKTMAQLAPKGTSKNSLRTLIRSLNVTNFRSIGGGVSVWLPKKGSFRLTINLGAKKHLKILWVDQGTGIFGPNKKPITPTTSRFLVFTIGKETIFATQVKGQKPQRFIKRALEEIRPKVNEKIIKGFS